LATLQQRFADALTGLITKPEKLPDYLAMIKPSQDEKRGDYQANMAMPLAKELGQKPLDVAKQIGDRLQVDDLLEAPVIAPPGFINLRFKADRLAELMRTMEGDERLDVAAPAQPKTYVIDYSSP